MEHVTNVGAWGWFWVGAFLLLFIGIVMPTVFYILWGIMEIATIPVAP